METVAITLSSSYINRGKPKDLVLPLDTPQYILINALIETFSIAVDSEVYRGFLSLTRKGKVKSLSAEKTLRDAGVRVGDFLKLDFQEILANATLVCVDGPEFDLIRDETIIGCHPDVDVDLRSVPRQEFVSKTHAKITFHDEKYYLEDFNSRNGTYINDRRISKEEKVLLESGDIFRLGASDDQGVHICFKIRKKK